MFLNTHSEYSFRYGTIPIRELVELFYFNKCEAAVLTDINSTSGVIEFIQACVEIDIKPVIGIEFRIKESTSFIGIAKNRAGWKELCLFLTVCKCESNDDFEIPHFHNVFIIYFDLPFEKYLLKEYEYLGIRLEDVKDLEGSSILSEYGSKMVVLAPITFRDPNEYYAHKILRSIDLNITWAQLSDCDSARSSEYIVSEEEILSHFVGYPEIIENTKLILDSCSISLETEEDLNKQVFTRSKKQDYDLLYNLTIQGCKLRFGNDDLYAMERTAKELAVINFHNFESYFLVAWDAIQYSKSKGFRHVGRGSGANSLVAYNLGISDVNPIDLELYFERFINPHRSSPPDFDIDFSWDERDDVTRYLIERYGKEHVALLGTYSTFKGKSIIREIGKVLGLPKFEIDKLIKYPLNKKDHHPYAEFIFKYGKVIEGLPNYLSIHAGGVLISEKPLTNNIALQMMPKGFPIVQADMYDAERWGYHKFDILSQRGLGHIKDAISIVKNNRGIEIHIDDVEAIKNDVNVKAKLKSGNCIGCFYIESPAMRGLLSKLKCDNYVHLVAASSIIRPGVAQSGMMREYIKRFHNPNCFEYIHEVFEKHLGETFGVMVYQEDVMKIVHHFSGLGLDESDVLRRIMTGKRKNSKTFESLKNKYYENCRERGYSEELSQEVWRQIASFSGYSFCKAHSASYAVESFQSLFLKTYFPKEFMVAVINNFGGFYSTELYFHEARMSGAKLEPPCINKSERLTSIYGDEIYVGFIHVSELRTELVQNIVSERIMNGSYKNVLDFVKRVEISKDQLEILIRVGSFRFSKLSKYQLMWEVNKVYNEAYKSKSEQVLFSTEETEDSILFLKDGVTDQAYDEIEFLGFPLSSPFDLLNESPRGDILSKEMKDHLGKEVIMIGYFVTKKHVTTVNKKHMNFGTFIDRDGDFFDTTHFPNVLSKYPFKGGGCYLVKGRVVVDFDFHSLDVTSMRRLAFKGDERFAH